MPVTDVHHDLDALTLTITADFAAPVERVWEVYADPRQLERVWGPPTYPATFVDHELAPGGRMNYFLTSPEGEKYYAYWEIAEVNQPKGFTFNDGFAVDETFAPNPEMPSSFQEFSFAENAGSTRATFVATYPTPRPSSRCWPWAPSKAPPSRSTRSTTCSPPDPPSPREEPSCVPSSSPSSSPSTASSTPPAAATTRTPAGPSRTSSSTRRPTRSRAARRRQATALLFGRQSYDEFAPVWPSMEEFATYNAMPKYVVSSTLSGHREWHNTSVLRSLDEVAALKETEGGEIHVHGSATLAQGLAARRPGRPLPPARLPDPARQRQAALRRRATRPGSPSSSTRPTPTASRSSGTTSCAEALYPGTIW